MIYYFIELTIHIISKQWAKWDLNVHVGRIFQIWILVIKVLIFDFFFFLFPVEGKKKKMILWTDQQSIILEHPKNVFSVWIIEFYSNGVDEF